MAISLHRFQSHLWRARGQSYVPAVTGARWMSSPQSPLPDIEVNAALYIFSRFVYRVLMSVPARSIVG